MLDIWGVDEKIIVGKHQLYEVTNTRPPIPKILHPLMKRKWRVMGEMICPWQVWTPISTSHLPQKKRNLSLYWNCRFVHANIFPPSD